MAKPPINQVAKNGKINNKKIIIYFLILGPTKIAVITEKISIKKDTLRCDFIQDKESSFYSSPIFNTILKKIQENSRQCQLKQTSAYLMLKAKGIRNIKEAQIFLEMFSLV